MKENLRGLIVFAVLFFLVHFSKAQGTDYYWIGGSGNWSDTLHWSSSEGGIPTWEDNVYFDANSFNFPNQVVTIDVPAACNMMDWSGVTMGPTLAGNKEFTFHGSLVLAPNMQIDFTGPLYFTEGGSYQSIQTAGNKLNSHIHFVDNGKWEIQDDLDIGNKNFYLNGGQVNILSSKIYCGNFYSVSAFDRSLNLNSVEFNIQGNNGAWDVNGNINLNKGNSLIVFTNNNSTLVNQFAGGGQAYHNVRFNNNAIIKNNNSFDNLYLSPGFVYEFEGGMVQTIQENIYARGCAGLIEIQSTNATQAKIAKNGGDLNISFVILRNIAGMMSSGGIFNAYNAVDEGNNSGINIFSDSRDMYWINGSGNWTDTLHWSSSPPGPDADCLPLYYDNVFFDENSFNGNDTVYVNQDIVKCNDMIWSGSDPAVFKSSASNPKIRIFGSLQFSEPMINEFAGPFFFSDTLGGKIIKSSNNYFNSNIIFDGSGSWEIFDSLKVNHHIYFKKGSLTLNTDFATCKTFHSDSAYFRYLNLGEAKIEITGTSPAPAWEMNTENLILDAGTSEIILTQSNAVFCNKSDMPDTIQYHNLNFAGIYHSGRLDTKNEILCRFNRVTFSSNGLIYGNNVYDTLSFSPGNRYEFQSGAKQTILSEIWPSGECTGPILIRSQDHGQQMHFHSDNDLILLEYTTLHDVDATGNATFIANNSIDLGNNTGWTEINQVTPGTLYWVGGAGAWNDPAHWSDTPNGPGGMCIPTPYDTVIFDQYSFSDTEQVVDVNLNNAFAHDLLWYDVGYIPDFAGSNNSYELLIFGSLVLHPDMEFTFPGEIFFESNDTAEVIQTHGIKFHNVNNNVYFKGKGGEWNLLNSLDLGLEVCNRNVIYFMDGRLNSNSHPIAAYDFYSNYSNERVFDFDSSFIHLCHDFIVNGTNLTVIENNSLIEIDSGKFYHRYGEYAPYYDVKFTSPFNEQYLETYNIDSILFNNISFVDKGVLKGNNSYVAANTVTFNAEGKVNESNAGNANIYRIDSLLFGSVGTIYGNDTVNFLRADSTCHIEGSGDYGHALLQNDANIYGFNEFDTLSFSPGFRYTLEGNALQTIIDEFNIKGNNCQSIYLNSSSSVLAGVYKEADTVWGEFIEMENIIASGEAVFDAGTFSSNINNSNQGWLFHDSPLNYSLGADTSILEGDTLHLCADFFNGNENTLYEWKYCTTGEIISNDMCIDVTEKGYYCLKVTYDEGPGCEKYDTIFVGCYLGLNFNADSVSCYGFSDGSIEMEIYSGVEPFDIQWYFEDQPIDTTQNIYDLMAGVYYVQIEDGEECVSYVPVEVLQPDSLQMSYVAKSTCFEIDNGTILIDIEGGTEPYSIYWPDGLTEDTTFVDGLAEGIYQVEIVDFNNCPSIGGEIEITELPELSFQLTGYDLLCHSDSSGFIEISDIEGGSGNYTQFSWYKDGEFYSTEMELNDLQSGEYSIIIEDDFNCQASKSVFLYEPEPLILEMEGIDGITELGSIDLTVTGGTEPYSYLWNTGEVTQDIDPLGGGMYTVQVTDENVCKSTDSIWIDVHFRVLAPTAFSPNGDGTNEEFEVHGIGTDLKEYKMIIFNRWGQQVFQTTDHTTHWNGKLNNSGPEQPVGVYTWQISITYIGGAKTIDLGNVTLLK
jgi:gliding motility-associated-like protein